jgi:tetratricopeptide (TPR) repeat protein
LNGYNRDYIVIGSVTEENYPAVHEFTHLLVEHTNVDPPLWFNEGLAELYSTVKPFDKRGAVGQVIPGHYYFLQQNKWLPLDTLLAVDRNSPYYSERNQTGIFYSESWALMHMLMLSPAYRPQVEKVWQALAAKVPGGNALSQVYAKTTAQVQKDLETYMRGTSFNAAVYNVKLENSAEEPDIEPASLLESGTVLPELLALTHKPDVAKQAYESLARDFPNAWEPEAGLAELAWRASQPAQAQTHFARAVDLGVTNPRLYYDCSMVLRDLNEKSTAAIPLLKKAVELDPGCQDTLYYLACCLLQDRHYQEAIDHLKQVKTIKVAQTFAY